MQDQSLDIAKQGKAFFLFVTASLSNLRNKMQSYPYWHPFKIILIDLIEEGFSAFASSPSPLSISDLIDYIRLRNLSLLCFQFLEV